MRSPWRSRISTCSRRSPTAPPICRPSADGFRFTRGRPTRSARSSWPTACCGGVTRASCTSPRRPGSSSWQGVPATPAPTTRASSTSPASQTFSRCCGPTGPPTGRARRERPTGMPRCEPRRSRNRSPRPWTAAAGCSGRAWPRPWLPVSPAARPVDCSMSAAARGRMRSRSRWHFRRPARRCSKRRPSMPSRGARSPRPGWRGGSTS